MKPMFALHKNAAGQVIGAHSFSDDYELGTWVRKLDLRDGDTLNFGAALKRPKFEEVDQQVPAFITQTPEAGAGEDLSF